MATLYFKVSSDWEQVVKLRQECEKLEAQLKKMDVTKSPAAARTLETQLASTKQQMMGLVTEAAKAGAVIENDFKKKIYDASQTVNNFTEKIIAQKNVVKNVEADVKRLGEAYRSALKNNPISASFKLSEYNSAKRSLDEERAALFVLTQEQATARLSVKKLRDEYALYKKEAGETIEANEKMSVSLGKVLGVIGGVTALKRLSSEIIRVRGEFQSMQTAIETMVGKDMAGKLIPQIKELAKVSPLTLTDMVNAEKMMLGFNIQAEDTIRYLQALSDISMGNSVKFNSLTLAFSQMSAAGKLMGQDLNQMINAGFNPLQQIAEKTGKSIATLKNEMSKGAISAEMVQQAFIDATSAGGKFYQMSENASKTINGQLSMMQDALDNAFNEIGTASEGVIMKGIQVTTSLIENYETIGKVLVGLIATYGTYRGILIATTALEQVKNGTLLTTIKNTKLATAAQAAFNKVVKAHPYALIASLAIGAATAIFAFSERTTNASKASAQLSANIKNETYGLDSLFKKLKSAKEGTDERKKAIEQINSKYGSYLSNLLSEKSSVEDIADAYEKAKKSIIDYNIEKSKNEYLQEPLSGLNKATQEFYESISNFSKGLSNDEQKGRFKAYIDQIVDSVRDGGYFDINQVYTAFRAAQAKQSYKNVDEWREAFRAGKEDFGMSDTDIIDVVGGFDISNVRGAGKQLEAFSESLKKAKTEFDSFSKSYREVSSTANQEELPTSNISQEIENVTSKIKSLKQEIADLRNGKIQVEAGKTVESAISAKEKELQAAKKSLETLTGQKQTDRKEVSSRQKLSEELLSLRRKNQQDEINLMEEGTEKKIAQINLDYEKERDAIKKQAEKWAQEQGGTLTTEQTILISASYSNAKKRKDNRISDVNEEQVNAARQAMNEYLKEYGNYQEKRLAITEEYNRRIAEATTSGESLSLKKELENSLKELDFNEFKNSIDFSDVFGNVDEQTTSALESLRDKLSEYINQAAKDLRPEDLKELQDAFSNIEFEITDRKPFDGLKNGLDEYRSSQEQVRKAQEDLNTVMSGGEVIVGLYTDENGKLQKKLLTTEQAEKKVTEAQKKRQESLEKITQSANSIGAQGMEVVNAGGEIMDMLESFGVELPEAVSQTLDGLGQAMSGLASIDFTRPFSAITGVVSVISGLGKAIAGWFGGKKKVISEETFQEYDRLTSAIDNLINKQKELIETTDTVSGEIAAREAEKLARKQQEASQNLLYEYLNSYDGSKHTVGYNIQKWFGDYRDEIKEAGLDFDKIWGDGRVTGLSTLSASEIEALQSIPELWAKLPDKVRGFLEDVVAAEDSIKETGEALEESLAGVSFDSFKDSYRSILKDLDADNEDLADNLEEYLKNAMIDSLIDDVYNDELKKLYDKFVQYRKSDSDKGSDISEDELEALRRDKEKLANQMMADRDALAELYGWESDAVKEQNQTQSQASSRGFGSEMTHEDAGELSGRFTAVAESNYRIESATQQQTLAITEIKGSIAGLALVSTGIHNIADETRTILANSYLELQEIKENTGNSAKYLKDIKADIAVVKQNTSKL